MHKTGKFVSLACSQYEERGEIIRFLSADFAWTKERTPEGVSCYLTYDLNDSCWVITAGTTQNWKEEDQFVIDVYPSYGYEQWVLGTSSVKLCAKDLDTQVFTSLWKAFEEKLTEVTGKADLVQLSGYYQYDARIIGKLASFLETTIIDQGIALNLILRHINQSDYAARLMEIAMHSLMQAMQEYQVFSNSLLKPLSQMRSANKKHGNVGDIELLEDRQIVEAWDAKYGKSYLRDEIEELSEKLEVHPAVRRAGFVTSLEPERLDELKPRCEEIEEIFGISLEILTFEEWVQEQFDRALAEEATTEQELASAWIRAYAQSLAQQRREIAPIDEPCYQWLFTLNETLTQQ